MHGHEGGREVSEFQARAQRMAGEKWILVSRPGTVTEDAINSADFSR